MLAAGSGLASRAVNQLSALVCISIVRHAFGADQFGVWSICLSVLMWIGIADFGITNGLMTILSECNGSGDVSRARKALATGIVDVLGIGGILCLLASLPPVAEAFSSLFGLSAGLRVDRATLLVLAVAFVLSMLAGLMRQLYYAYQVGHVYNLALAAGGVVQALLFFGLKGAEVGIAGFLLAWTFPSLLVILVCWLLASRFCKGVGPSLGECSLASNRSLLRVSGPIFVYQLGALLVNQCQVVVLSRRAGPSFSGDYSVVMNLYLIVMGILVQATSSFVPAIHEALISGDRDWAKRSVRRMVATRMGLALLAAAGFLLLGRIVLQLWLKERAPVLGMQAWGALSLMLVASVWSSVFGELLMIFGHARAMIPAVLLNGAVTCGLTYLLVGPYGMAGVFFATGFFSAVVLSWWMPWLYRKHIASRFIAKEST